MTPVFAGWYNLWVFLPKKTLPKSVEHVLKILSRHLVPPTGALKVQDIEEEVVRDARRILFEFPLFYRWGFLLGILFLEYSPFLFGFGLSRFTRLKHDLQSKYVDDWAHSRIIAKREFFKGVKGLILIVYFSDRQVWEYIGYDPDPHLAERIALRDKLVGTTDIPKESAL